MKILLVADGRSPITRGWIRMVRSVGVEVSLVSTFHCERINGIAEPVIIPAAFSSMAGSQVGVKSTGRTSQVRGLVGHLRGLLLTGRYWLGPLSLGKSQKAFLDVVDQIKPDVVHALRIPFEGMLARVTPAEIPFIVSIWGNDLTLHAQGSPLMARETRKTLKRANALLADAHRDLNLAADWGLPVGSPTLCVPGGGGIDLEAMRSVGEVDLPALYNLPANTPLVVNPRGFRPGSVRNDTFFKAIPLVLKAMPAVIFVCAGMAGQPEAVDWVRRLGIEKSVRLLPFLPQQELWQLFTQARVSVSISQHDGTPNSLLEAMALGCYPVVGDIESTREWINDGENGRLVSPADVAAAARAILGALESGDQLAIAAVKNGQIIQEKANRQVIAGRVKELYDSVIKN